MFMAMPSKSGSTSSSRSEISPGERLKRKESPSIRSIWTCLRSLLIFQVRDFNLKLELLLFAATFFYHIYIEGRGRTSHLLQKRSQRRRTRDEVLKAKKEIEDIRKGGAAFKLRIHELKSKNANLEKSRSRQLNTRPLSRTW